ncbi:exosome complex protein Rrp42 [Candidatus Woesearchaeota archaeon]|nr:exosome complex protein Rrp42 [Candidatus Woesearchaeota archaeon]
MNIIQKHIHALLEKDQRLDGRKFDELRKNISIEYGISPKSAEGSAKVRLGNTEVVAGIKFEVITPYPDQPDKGTIMAGVELLPLSSPEFESGPPNIRSVELARAVVDRGLRESGAIDFKSLCIKKEEKAWAVVIDVYSMNDEGNLADAIGLCALAALKDAKFPKYDEKNQKVVYEERTNKGLTLKELPIPITIVKIKDKILVDPILEEEEAADSRLTVTTLEDGRVCAMQKGGKEPLTAEEVDKMIELSIKKGKELRKVLEKSSKEK